MIMGLTGRTYEEKLTELNMRSLLSRRTYIDMVQTFKIIKGYDRVDSSTLFNLVGPNIIRPTRYTNSEFNIIPTRSNLDIRRNFYTNRVAATWNNLPVELKNARSVTSFKTGLDKIDL